MVDDSWGNTPEIVEVKKEDKQFKDYFLKEIPKTHVYLFYGDTGTGKTFLSMDFPEPIYIIDTESRASANICNYPDKDVKIFCPLTLPVNAHESLDNIRNFITDFAKGVNNGTIKKGTLVVDSVTDIWSWVQHESIEDLSGTVSKDGKAKANTTTMRFQSQMDWRIPNKRHFEILGAIRNLIFKGFNVILTARENIVPEYVKLPTNKHKIRCQKDIPFTADVIVRLAKSNEKFCAVVEKLAGRIPIKDIVENITYKKLKEMVKNDGQ